MVRFNSGTYLVLCFEGAILIGDAAVFGYNNLRGRWGPLSIKPAERRESTRRLTSVGEELWEKQLKERSIEEQRGMLVNTEQKRDDNEGNYFYFSTFTDISEKDIILEYE